MEENKPSSSVVLKSGLWYTISNFAFRAVAFITTPIFARILSQSEYGQYNNFASWLNLLLIICTFDIQTSVVRAKLDYEKDLNTYSLSALVLTTIFTCVIYVIFLLNQCLFSDLIGIDPKYFHIMFIYIIFVEAYYVYITYERSFFRYKKFSILTGVSIVLSCLLSLVLICILPDKLDARIYGWYIPYIIIGFIMYLILIKRSNRIRFKYIKYAFSFSVPLLPHLLSMELLSSSDRIMITKMCGAQFTAIYSIAYIVSNIMYILLDSLNKAWSPWFLESLKTNNRDEIQKASTPYFYLFLALVLGALFLAPEIVLILGGGSYMSGIYVIPPLLIGVAFQFAYTMYVQVEYYEKKVKIVSLGTIVAAIINILLNLLFIPIFGFIAAAYTTLFGYITLFCMHYFTVQRLGYNNIFNRKYIFAGLGLGLLSIPIFTLLYSLTIARYVLFIAYFSILAFVVYKNKNVFIKMLKTNN